MANENKNSNNLVATDLDATAEMEELTWRREPPADAPVLTSESDARTFDFANLKSSDPEQQSAITELQTDLEARSRTIDRLQFDIEQLHAKWLGLETEIKAREELTGDLADQLKKAESTLARKDHLIQKRDESIDALESGLEKHLAQIEDLQNRNNRLDEQLQAQNTLLSGIQIDLSDARNKAEDRQAEIITFKKTQSLLISEAQEASAEIEELKQEKATLRHEIDSVIRGKMDDANAALKRQSEQILGRDNTIKEIRAQLRRTERYSDQIRQQLQDRIVAHENIEQEHAALQASLAESGGRVESLNGDLQDAQQTNDQLLRQIDELKSAHEDEIRMVRFELGEAQETVAQHEQVNEQLASDLVDTSTSKVELEEILRNSEEQKQAQIEKLEKQLKESQHAAEEFEEKLQTKDNAIRCLLAELAKKSEQLESIGKIENVIQDIDERMSERIEERPGAERERMSRMLIGTIDGKEVRFPLFKDRLTIGRSHDNDIQLKAHYISRRHAVVLTEGDTARVVDWGSKNGVYVNSKRITEHFLKSGDVVTIGTADFRFEERPKRDS